MHVWVHVHVRVRMHMHVRMGVHVRVHVHVCMHMRVAANVHVRAMSRSLCLGQTDGHGKFWRRAVDFDFLVEEGVIDLEDRELFWFAETAQDIWNGILAWYDAAGEPLDVGG